MKNNLVFSLIFLYIQPDEIETFVKSITHDNTTTLPDASL